MKFFLMFITLVFLVNLSASPLAIVGEVFTDDPYC